MNDMKVFLLLCMPHILKNPQQRFQNNKTHKENWPKFAYLAHFLLGEIAERAL